MRRILAVAFASILLSACNILGVACTSIALPGIQVSVVAATGGTAITDPGMVIVTDGTFADTARIVTGAWPASVGLAHERAGTYTVQVLAEGYTPWSEDGVRVERGECHVDTAELTAELHPSS